MRTTPAPLILDCVDAGAVELDELAEELAVDVPVAFVALAAAWNAVKLLLPLAGALTAKTMPFSQCPV